MPTPYTSSTVSSTVNSNTLNIDALLSGYKWGGVTGSQASVSFSFPWVNGASANFSGPNGTAYSSNGEASATYHFGLNSVQQNAAINALQAWASVANITFNQVADTSTNVGDIRFAFTSASSITQAWGYADYPDSYYPSAGDVWINSKYASEIDWSVGSYNYEAIMHEIGHAIGLKHPGNYNVGGGGEAPPYLPSTLDNRTETIMSYSDVNNLFEKIIVYQNGTKSLDYIYVNPSTPMVLDIQAIQYIYGANTTYHTGDDIYTFDPKTPFLKTIWDAGGNDIISVYNFSTNCIIDLRSGHYSTIVILSDNTSGINWVNPPLTPTYDNKPNLGIAYGSIIENAIGGAGNDIFYGNQANNNIDGGDGIDKVYFSGKRSDYLITLINQIFTIKDNRLNSPDGTDSLKNCETAIFVDKSISLTPNGIIDSSSITPTITSSVKNFTNLTQPLITGNAAANSSIVLFDGTKSIATARAGADGSFNLTPSSALLDGLHSLSVIATDTAGNVSVASNSISFTLDTIAPVSPIISTTVSSPTRLTQPIITGKAEANSSITLYDGTKSIATSTVGADGNFSLIPSSALSVGQHSLTARVTDAAGNVSQISNALNITIDMITPVTPVIFTTVSSITKIAQPNITGTGDSGFKIVLYDGTKSIGTTTVSSNGTFSLTPSIVLADGVHSLTATETDAAGNVSSTSNTITFIVDTIAPVSPFISTAVSSPTKLTQPIITGKAEANSSITLFDGIISIAQVKAGADGSFSLAPSSALTDGIHILTSTSTDAAGNVSLLSNALFFTVNAQTVNPGVYSNASKYYSITLNPTSIQVTDHTGSNSVDTYSSIASLKFSDMTLDTTMFTKTAALSHSSIVNLVELYIASFNRAPDSVGLDYWGGRLSDGMSLEQIAKSFFTQKETIAAYPSGMATKDFVTTVYNNVLSRGPDTGGLNYWVGQLDKGIVSKDSFLLAIINGAMASTGSAVDRQTLANKEAVGEHYAIYQGLNNSTNWAKDVMSAVTDQMATVTAANAKSDAYAAIAANPATSDLVVKLVGVAV